MEYLYVCHFSNGHIKVGRSIDPKSRVAQHADRVACIGVELVEHQFFECIGDSLPAEYALIDLCATTASRRNKSEWFEGLDYPIICNAAKQIASQIFEAKTGIQKAVALFENSPTKLAAAVGNGVLRQHVEHWLNSGRVSAERCADIAAATGIPLEELNDKVDWAFARSQASV